MDSSPTRKSVSPAPVLNQRLSTSREMPRRMSWSLELTQFKRSAHIKQNALVAEMTNNKSHNRSSVSINTYPMINSQSTLNQEKTDIQNNNNNAEKQTVIVSQADILKKDEPSVSVNNNNNNLTKIDNDNNSSNNEKEKV